MAIKMDFGQAIAEIGQSNAEIGQSNAEIGQKMANDLLLILAMLIRLTE